MGQTSGSLPMYSVTLLVSQGIALLLCRYKCAHDRIENSCDLPVVITGQIRNDFDECSEDLLRFWRRFFGHNACTVALERWWLRSKDEHWTTVGERSQIATRRTQRAVSTTGASPSQALCPPRLTTMRDKPNDM
ncbi:hypothetical protein BC629DRAFT_755098 [Irpex lacteus]|nr:hypothetical protein BC629DRAFT_755098 [Irpex lacteus]